MVSRIVEHHYSVHVPGRYSPRDRQGLIFFLVKHSTQPPRRIANIKHKLSTTGEEVLHDRIHYGDGAEAISITEVAPGAREFEITGHELVERGLPGHLPIYGGGTHSIHIGRSGAIRELMQHVDKTGLSNEESRQLKKSPGTFSKCVLGERIRDG